MFSQRQNRRLAEADDGLIAVGHADQLGQRPERGSAPAFNEKIQDSGPTSVPALECLVAHPPWSPGSHRFANFFKILRG